MSQPAPPQDFEARGNRKSLLSEREVQILVCAARGMSDDRTARDLGLTRSTVNSYWVRIRGKLGQESRTAVVVVAWRLGLIDLTQIADEIMRKDRQPATPPTPVQDYLHEAALGVTGATEEACDPEEATPS